MPSSPPPEHALPPSSRPHVHVLHVLRDEKVNSSASSSYSDKQIVKQLGPFLPKEAQAVPAASILLIAESHTIVDLVDHVLKTPYVKERRYGHFEEDANSHMWNFVFPQATKIEGPQFLDEEARRTARTLASLNLAEGDEFKLTYDYGTTTVVKLRLEKMRELANNEQVQNFPRIGDVAAQPPPAKKRKMSVAATVAERLAELGPEEDKRAWRFTWGCPDLWIRENGKLLAGSTYGGEPRKRRGIAAVGDPVKLGESQYREFDVTFPLPTPYCDMYKPFAIGVCGLGEGSGRACRFKDSSVDHGGSFANVYMSVALKHEEEIHLVFRSNDAARFDGQAFNGVKEHCVSFPLDSKDQPDSNGGEESEDEDSDESDDDEFANGFTSSSKLITIRVGVCVSLSAENDGHVFWTYNGRTLPFMLTGMRFVSNENLQVCVQAKSRTTYLTIDNPSVPPSASGSNLSWRKSRVVFKV